MPPTDIGVTVWAHVDRHDDGRRGAEVHVLRAEKFHIVSDSFGEIRLGGIATGVDNADGNAGTGQAAGTQCGSGLR